MLKVKRFGAFIVTTVKISVEVAAEAIEGGSLVSDALFERL